MSHDQGDLPAPGHCTAACHVQCSSAWKVAMTTIITARKWEKGFLSTHCDRKNDNINYFDVSE